MQNNIQKFRQHSIVFEKPGILSEMFKTLTSSNWCPDGSPMDISPTDTSPTDTSPTNTN